jgi:hypothetical protein
MVDMSSLIALLATQYPWLGYAIVVAAILPHVVALLPQPSAGTFAGRVWSLLNGLSGNYGSAANAVLATPTTFGPAVAAAVASPTGKILIGLNDLAKALEARRTAAAPPAPAAPEHPL